MPSSSGSSSVPDGFVAALVQYGEASDSRRAEINSEFDALFARIKEGKGKETIAATVNGKYFGFQVTLTNEQKFAAFGEALRELNVDLEDGSGKVVRTYPDFSGLIR